MNRPRVIYWNNIPTPYMVERFNALIRRGNMDLEVWFGAVTEPDRSWAIDRKGWAFPFRFLPQIGLGRRRLTVPSRVLVGAAPDLLVSLYASPAFLLGLRLAWWRHWRTALWVPVTFDAWVRRHWWNESLKRLVFRRVDGIITPGQDGRKFAMRYGAPADRIHIARHGIDTDFFASATAAARPAREAAREAMGLSGVVFLYVGRLWNGKGIATLLAAYAAVERQLRDTSLLLVGDGPDSGRVAAFAEAEGLRIVLSGFRQRHELPGFYAVADAFVFPTLGDPYGLVVDEAMAAGLPIISSTAAGEIGERVFDGVNGFLVPPRDPDALAVAMRGVATEVALRRAMGERSARIIAPYTPEHWASAFERAVDEILSRPGRRSAP